MLFRVGLLELDTFPFELGGSERDHEADYARHAVIGIRKPFEAVGPGDDTVTLRGQLMPFHIGGLSELALAHQLVDRQDPLFCMRGDGGWTGWYHLTRVGEKHDTIGPGGVGFVATYTLKLERCDRPGSDVGGRLMSSLSSLVSSLFG